MRDGCLEQLELAAAGVEAGAHAQRQGPLVVDVPDGEAVGDRDTERQEIVREDLVEAERAIAHRALELGEPAHGDAGEPLQRAGHPEMGEHPVHPIEILTHVLEEEDGAVEIREVRRADQALQQREVAAGERSFGHAAVQGRDPVVTGKQDIRRIGQPAKPPGGLRGPEDPLEVPAGEGRHRDPGHRARGR